MTDAGKIGRFKILKELGRGSQGVVYLAVDSSLERKVAIKTIHRHHTKLGEKQERLMREARTVSRLQHPNIIPLYEANEHKGLLYLVFEYVDGKSLKERIAGKGPFVVHEAIQTMIQILDGIEAAHSQGVVHRDLSPNNIMLDKKGMPRIMDFGISVIIENGKSAEKSIEGTPCYMSPEHFSEGRLTPQSDIFSLGLIFYEILTGNPVFSSGNDFSVMYKIAHEKIDPPSLKNSTIDKKLDQIVLKALEKEPGLRYSSANRMKTDLKSYLENSAEEKPEAGTAGSHSTIDFLLRRMRHKSDFPTFSKNIVEINKRASVSQVNYASASELANAVLKDYSVTNKLLKLVNSAFYGQFAGKITTVSRAVVVLGFEQVGMAASSLMLFEQLKNKGQSTELRDAAVSSFMSGLIAKDMAKQMQIPDTEEAFICSMLHNLGQYLVLFYFPEEYNQIKNLMARKGIKEAAAVRSVLGISYEDLGIGVAKNWKFPDKIVNTLKEIPKGELPKPKTDVEMLRNLSGFSNELCTLIGGTENGDGEKALKELMSKYDKSFPLAKSALSKILDSARDNLEGYSKTLDINLQKSLFVDRLKRYKENNFGAEAGDEDFPAVRDMDKEREPDPVKEGAVRQEDKTIGKELQGESDFEIRGTSLGPAEQKDPYQILINGIQDITNTLLEDFKLNDILTMILETMYRGFGFNRVLFCLLDQKNGEMRARFGFGENIDKVTRNFYFKVSPKPDVFNFAIASVKDIGIHDTTDVRIEKRIPQWYNRYISAPAFVIYPLLIDKQPVGIIYADRNQKGQVIAGNHLNYMKTLCNQAVLALKQKSVKK